MRTEEDQEAWEKLCKSFMAPDIDWLTQLDIDGINEPGNLDSNTKLEVPGIYARLSAPGFLDCTDWEGPFDDVAKAEKHLVETYGDFE